MTMRDLGQYAVNGTEHQSHAGTQMRHGLGAHSNNASHDNATRDLEQRHHNHRDLYDALDEMHPSATSPPTSPPVAQMPPIPVSPISPRWDSLTHNNFLVRPDRSISREGHRTVLAGPREEMSPSPGPSSQPFSSGRNTPVPLSPSIRNFSLRETHAGAYYRPLTPSSPTTRSFQSDSSPARDAAPGVGNFSRPRKPSVRQGGSELLVPRQRICSPDLAHTDQPLTHISTNPSLQQSVEHRGRGYSTSSVPNAIPRHVSNDQIGGAYKSASVRRATPSSNMTRPPLTYNEALTPSATRETPPWVAPIDDELRSSVRSQLTVSTALGTVFTANGTERSSVLTKTSSATESLILDGYARTSAAEEDDLSVEDVMGMYENGFHDDSDEEDGGEADRDGSEDGGSDRHDFGPGQAPSHEDEADDIRPSTAHSRTGRLVSQMLEAMTESMALPPDAPLPNGRVIARDSAAIFRNSGLPSSLPENVDFGTASERPGTQTVVDDDVDGSSMPHDGFPSTPVQDEPQATANPVEGEHNVEPSQPESSTPVPHTLDTRLPSRAGTPVSAFVLPPEPEEDPSSRDRYGFRKANQYITREQYDKWDASYTEYLARRRKKWVAFLKDSSLMTENPNRFPQRSTKTKRFVRKGIPPSWRGAAWFYYAGGPKILAKHPGVYDDMVRRAGLEPSGPGRAEAAKCDLKPIIVEDIEKDLHRTFPDNVRFRPPRTANLRRQAGSPVGTEDSQATLTEQPERAAGGQTDSEPEIISSLRRVLHAFALYNPRIGYCQSLNFLAGLLLLFVESEEHAFWLLNVITRVYLPGTHEMNLEGSKVDLGVLMATLKDALPSVWKQIGGDDSEMAASGPKRAKTKLFRDISNHQGKNAPVDPNRLPAITLCMTAWFMSCFIGTLPIETVLRVWDIFFYEGSRTLFRIALTILKAGEGEIKAVADPMEMFGVVQTLPRRMLDPNALLEACYKKRNSFKHLSQDVVDEKRHERREAIQKWKAAQEADRGAGRPPATRDTPAGRAAAGPTLAPDTADPDVTEVRRKGTLFGSRRKDKEKARAEDVL